MYHLIISAAYKLAEIRQLDCGQTLAMGADIQISRALYNTNYHTTGHSSRHDSFEADTNSARVGINFNVWSCKCCNRFQTLKFVLICAPTNTNATTKQRLYVNGAKYLINFVTTSNTSSLRIEKHSSRFMVIKNTF